MAAALISLLAAPGHAGTFIDRPEPAAGGQEAMSLADARVNFATAVENHLKATAPKGPFPFQDVLLNYDRVDETSVKEVSADRFVGCVLFKDGKDKPVDLDLTVDFSGDRWRVVSVLPHSDAAPPKTPARRAKPGRRQKKAGA